MSDKSQPEPTQPDRSRLPAASTRDPEALAQLRRFHYVGDSADASTPPVEAEQYRPAFPRLPSEEGSPEQETLTDLSAALRVLIDLAAGRAQRASRQWTSDAQPPSHSLRALLDADGGGTPQKRAEERGESLAHGLGELGTRFLDPGALAERVGSTTSTEPLEPARRARLEEALGQLEDSFGDKALPTTRVVCESDLAERYGLASSATSRLELAAMPCEVAAQRFDEEAAATARQIAALRVARLDLDGQYVPERHDLALEHFDWQAFHRSELDLLPAVLAIVSADHVAGAGMASLSRLLLSGRPVQVVVVVEPAASPGGTDRDTGFRFEPGYLGLGHREAFIHQSSPAAPQHLRQGFERALAGTRTALHVLAADPGAGALDGRAHPLFVFDPEAGVSWSERFDVAGNPEPGADWPSASLAARASDSGETTLELAYTFADYSLERGRRSGDFLPIDDALGADELIDLPRWLELDDNEAGHSVPFLWAFDQEQRLRRLAVSRRLALECRDRLDYWRTLREFGNLNGATAGSAAQDSTSEPGEVGAVDRQQIAAEIVGRLVHGLLDGELVQAPVSGEQVHAPVSGEQGQAPIAGEATSPDGNDDP